MSRSHTLRCLSLFLAVLATVPVAAEPASQSVTTTYRVSMLGLPIGRASFHTVLVGGRYSVTGALASAGIGSLVASTSGGGSVSGRVGPDRFSPDRYGLKYASDDKTWSSDISFKSGAVASSEVSPKRAQEKADFVPVTPEHLSSAVDPFSGLMIRANDPGEVCNRTLPFFDGWSRLDLKLSPAGRETYAMEGYEGEAVVCDVAIRPLGGFRTSSRGLKYLKDRTISMWFAPIARKDIFVPVYAKIPTQVGSLTFTATSVSMQ